MNLNPHVYVRRHWRGEFSLALSFWINFILLYFVLSYLERFTLPPYVHGETKVTGAMAGFFLFARVVVYPWQVVGVIRACERYVKIHAERTWAIAAQGVVVLSIAATLAAAFASYQSLHGYRLSLHAADKHAPKYSLELIAEDGGRGVLLHLRGELQVGITTAVERMLEAHPRIEGVILDSGGGQIYEGRGLARVIREHGLNTYTLDECASSCATAFVAGVRRTLGVGARLGFHQYKNYAAIPVVDITEEHDKDAAVYRAQGVSPAFLQKIFDPPPDDMWWPAVEELLDAGVVHEVGFSPAGR